MDVVVQKMATHQKNDPVNTSGTASNLHGLNPWNTLGLFAMPGVDPQMYSTILNANGSFSRALSMRPTRFIQQRREILTGITEDAGTNPANFCGDPVRPGNMKVCRHDFEFGEYAISTDTVEGPKVGAYYTVADMDRNLTPSQPVNRGPFTPDVVNAATNPNSITWKQLNQVAQSVNLRHETVLWQGNKSAGATGAGSIRGFIKQPEGLERLIKRGYTDVVSGQACTGVDSRVVTYNGNVGGSSAVHGTIVDTITDQIDGLEMDLGETMGYSLESSSWAFVMHPRMWQAIARVWPCAYNTIGCDTLSDSSGQRLNIDAATQRRMQDEMYTGRFLWVNGVRRPVLFSWGISNPNVGNNQYTSSMYYVPFRLNGDEVLYNEYFDMGNEQQEQWYRLTGNNDQTRVINGGLYRMGRKSSPNCIEYTFSSMWRLLLLAPFAAIRWDNITYTDGRNLRSPYVGESFHADGGVTTRGGYSY
jgi:hypothetical protein